MLWFVFAFLAALFKSLEEVFSKKALQKVDLYIIGLGATFFSFLTILPLVLLNSTPEIKPIFWSALCISAMLNVAAIILQMKALKSSDLSIVSPMAAFTPIFIIFLSPFLLGEFPTLTGLIGISLVVFGSYVLNIEKFSKGMFEPIKALMADRGARLMLLVSFIWGISTVFDKIAILNSSPQIYALSASGSMFLGMAIIVILKSRKNFRQIHSNWQSLMLIGFLGGLVTLTQSTAISMALASYVISVKRMSLIFSVIFGYFIFKEKNIKERLLGAAIMVLGVVLIAFS